MFFFLLYIVAIVLCGSVNLGPVSLRVMATCFMTVWLIVTNKFKYSNPRIDVSYIWIYIVFSACMGYTLLLNGEFSEFEYLKKFLAFNFVSIISFWSINRFIGNVNQLKSLIMTLLIIIFVNNIVTIMQYNGDPLGWAIGYIFSDIDKSMGKLNGHDSLLGISATPGVFGDVVKNALYIAVITPLSFSLMRRNAHFYTKIFSLLVVSSSFVAAFMTQQRAAFALILLNLIIYIFIKFKNSPLVIFSIFIITLLSSLLIVDFSPQIELGRLADSTDIGRERLSSQAIDFIITHPLLGGPVSFLRRTGLPAHNLILDSYIYSGFLGFVIMMILFCKTTLKSSKNIVRVFYRGTQSNLIIFCSIAVLWAMAYGLFHNTSFLAGEVVVFILLAIMLKAEKINYLSRYD